MMKKMILSAIVMMATTAGYAQHEVGSLTVQPKVGLNIANMTDSGGADPRFGLAVGAELEYQVSDWFSLAGGAVYSMQGAKNKVDGVDATIKLDYINIPIVANFYVAKGLALKFGLQPGFNINSKASASASGVSASMSLSNFGIDIKTLDLSIPVGVSYEFNNVVIDGRYNVGATKLVDGDDTRNSVFQFTIGYKFGL